MKIVQCWIEHPIRSIDRTFTYRTELPLERGSRVVVDFNHRDVIGFVDEVIETSETLNEAENRIGYQIKEIKKVVDENSLLTDELSDMALWLKETTLSTTISCYQAILPQKLKPKGSMKPVVKEKWVRVTDVQASLTPKQLEAYLYVQTKGEMLYSDLRKMYPSIASKLIEKGVIAKFEKEKEAKDFENTDHSNFYELTTDQQNALDEICSTDDEVYLLKGVTGSGKTEIYMRLALQAIENGKQVLFLVPEIGLTPQMISRVSSRFGNKLAIYHSGLNDQEKYEQYQRVKNGKARIVVGTRSAVFLPFDDLGLIVLDEEHDTSYKQDNQPCYHCRDVAVYRGKYHHCKVILGSATPSLDSYARARKNVYHLVEMNSRIHTTLPDITTVSLKNAIRNGESYIITDTLRNKIQERLENHEQVILLLNRRGYTTQLRCKSCQEVVMCPHCDLALSYHKDDRMLKCHSCGTMIPVPRTCPKCGSTAGYQTAGYGTQKLEEEVRHLFPQSRVLRMDADTTTRKNSHKNIFESFGNYEADILLGTQMIAKGLDYPRVTLVGVLNGDEGLARTDFRSCEMTFDLLTQAAGRSGRSDRKGEVVFQVFDETHYAIQCAAKQDYEAFYAQEMRFRHAGMYPPYSYMIAITVYGKTQQDADQTAFHLKESLNGDFKTIGVLFLLKISDRYRDRIILKGKNLDEMRKAVRELLEKDKMIKGKDIRIDVNPMTLD